MHGEMLDRLLTDALWDTSTHYLGVFPRDQLPTSFIRCPSAYVANTDPSSQPGTQWVAFYHESPSSLEFFDSYSIHPSVSRFPLSPNFKILDINSTPIQSLHSSDCGQYCIFYLYQRSRGIPYYDIVSELRRNKNPDLFVRMFSSKLRLRYNESLNHSCCTQQSCISRQQQTENNEMMLQLRLVKR